jgi:hypothetical protein
MSIEGMGGHKMSRTPTYRIWATMLARCRTPSQTSFSIYGGRGIEVCSRWLKFENFLADMGERPPGLVLDRHPNQKGNYEPGNCRWATPAQNNRNRTVNRYITYQGRTQCLVEWSEELGIPKAALYARVGRLQWPIERAFTTPIREWGPGRCKNENA